MKTKLLFVLAICLASISLYAQQAPFITTWNTANPGTSDDNQITIPTKGTGYNYNVYWEDVNSADINGELTGLTDSTTITFPTSGTYRVEITGDFPHIHFNNHFARRGGGDREKILTVEQWGDIAWTSMEAAFFGCENLRIPATDAPDLSRVTSMFRMFRNATSFNEDIGHWDVSNITNMADLFAYARIFNQDISGWNVSKVTNMQWMFFWASDFNQDIGGWDVSNVTDMNSMFYLAKSFNQDIGEWNVGSVTDMSNMFTAADSFQQHIGNWNVVNVTDMSNMFSGSPYNQDIGSWDVSNVTDMSYMFSSSSFNQDISAWDVSSVENMGYMFSNADDFNQDIGNWDVSNVTNMRGMFSNSTFNQNLENWNVNNVTDMGWIFSNATLSLCNYDALLIGWAKLSLQENVSFDAGYTKYSSEASEARQSIIDNFSWNIHDGYGIKIEISIVNEISCPGQTDGVLRVLFYEEYDGFLGGPVSEDVVSYGWHTEEGEFLGSESALTGLAAGTYLLKADFGNGCTYTKPVSLEAPAALNITSIVSYENIRVEVTGGRGNYIFSWEGPDGFTSTEAIIVPEQKEGQYTVTVTDESGCQVSTLITNKVLSVEDEVHKSIRVYPNPATDYLIVQSEDAIVSRIELLNQTGQLVVSEKLGHTGSQNIALWKLQPGLYIYRLYDKAGNAVISKKFFIIR